MEKVTIKQILLLAVTTVILYHSGIYLMTINSIKSLFEGLIVMIFFFAIFPFLSLTTMLIVKFFKMFLGIKIINRDN